METDNSQQMHHKEVECTCALASRQLSALALYLLMKLDRIVRGMLDDGYSVLIVYTIVQ